MVQKDKMDYKFREKLIMESQLNVQKYGWGANFIENHDHQTTTKYLGK